MPIYNSNGVILYMKEPKWYQFFQDNESGKFSSMRLGFLITIVPIMVVWTWLSIITSTLIDVPLGISSLVGILATSKVGQLWVRKRYSKSQIKKKEQCSQKDSCASQFLSTLWHGVSKIWGFIKFKR